MFTNGLVSHAGPTQQQMEASNTKFTLFGSGYSSTPAVGAAAGPPDKQVRGTGRRCLLERQTARELGGCTHVTAYLYWVSLHSSSSCLLCR